MAPDTAKAGLRHLVSRSGAGSTLRAYKVACTLKSIAGDWVKAPAEQLEQLTRICRKLAPKAVGMTTKNRERLRAFDDRRNVGALLHLPQDLLHHARRHDDGLRGTAVQVQLAVAIELLLMTALRIGNLTRLHLEENLSWSRAARSGVVHVIVPEAEVKNGEPLEF